MRLIRFRQKIDKSGTGTDISINDCYIFLPPTPAVDELYLEEIHSQLSKLGWRLIDLGVSERTYLCRSNTVGLHYDKVTVSVNSEDAEVVFSKESGIQNELLGKSKSHFQE